MKNQFDIRKETENRRSVLFSVGLMTASAMTLAAFTYSNTAEIEKKKSVVPVDVVYVAENPDRPEKPEIKPISTPTPRNERQEQQINIHNDLTEETIETDNSTVEIETETSGGQIDIPFGDVTVIDDGVNDFELEPVEYPDEDAKFIGGVAAMKHFLVKNLKFPTPMLLDGKSDVVYVLFVVDKDGKVTRVKSINETYKEFMEEAERVIRLMPNWIPAEVKGQKVPSYVRIPIRFDSM